MIKRFNIFTGTKRWKSYVEQSLLAQADQIAELTSQVAEISSRLAGQAARPTDTPAPPTVEPVPQILADSDPATADRDALRTLTFHRLAIAPLQHLAPTLLARAGGYVVQMSRRNAELLLLLLAPDSPVLADTAGLDPFDMISRAAEGTLTTAVLIVPDSAGGFASHRVDGLFEMIQEKPVEALAWARDRAPTARRGETPPVDGLSREARFFVDLGAITGQLALIDFLARRYRRQGLAQPNNPPFSFPELLPSFMPAEPKRRSVLFSQHCYYNFYYLARALRARGWDAHCISTEAHESPQRSFYHGEDETIYDPDPITHRRQLAEFQLRNAGRFGIIHTYGVGVLSLFPINHDLGPDNLGMPWDILEAKRQGVLIGYSHSGCLDGVTQSSFRSWSPTMCANCVWEDNPAVCSDERNLAWGRKLTEIADLFCTETDPPLDFKGSRQAFRAPLTFAVDPEFWSPRLEIPEHYRRERKPGEVLVYHAMGNYQTRSREGRNVKGTGAVIAAVERLQAEGINIRLDFVRDVPSLDNRFIQSQADIIVDQLNYGRYGALAREGMMLGKPVVGRVEKRDDDGRPATRCILETPIVHADEMSVVDVLRALALDPARRAAIGAASRAHAIQWWSADRLAARFEQVYDHIRACGRPPSEEDVV